MAESAPKEQISIRIDPVDLAEIEKLGGEMKPVPLNRNVMIGLAVREYLDRHGKKRPRPKPTD